MNENIPKTHAKINPKLCGKIIKLTEQSSVIELTTTPEMGVDEHGLVHGGFIFGLADYAAMVAVNQPTVVLGGADVEFIKPAKVGDQLRAEAAVLNVDNGKKYEVEVSIYKGVDEVFYGKFECIVLKKHVLA
jgi:uncharacterized protein (TIGR00369 family)